MIDVMKRALKTFEKIHEGCAFVKEDDLHKDAKDLATYVQEDCEFTMKTLRQAIEQAEKESTLQEISDIGQEIHTDHPMRHWDRTCPACIAEAGEQEPVAYKYVDKHNPLIFYFTTHKDSLPNPEVIETALYTAPVKLKDLNK
jgi:hypothetical protein